MKGKPGFPPSRLHAFTPARQSASARRRGNDEKIWNGEKDRSRLGPKEQMAGTHLNNSQIDSRQKPWIQVVSAITSQQEGRTDYGIVG